VDRTVVRVSESSVDGGQSVRK